MKAKALGSSAGGRPSALVATLLAAFAAAASVGCGGRTRQQLVMDLRPVEQQLAVDVDSFAGDVHIEVDPTRPTVGVYAKRRAMEDWYRVGMNVQQRRWKETLDAIDVVAELDTTPEGLGVVRVTTATEYSHPDLQWVDLRIVLPRIDGARVRTQRGKVLLENVTGAITVSNQDGDVEVRTIRPLVDPVTITTAGGNILYRIGANSSGLIDAEAAGGQASIRAPEAALRVRQHGESRFIAELDPAVNPVLLRTSNGNVEVRIEHIPHLAEPQ